jgi:sterol desaturase/sphingolipid hydroxylase (fatty acid hydroxylase superfamily)
MNKYWQIIKDGYSDYWHYLVNTILQPGWNNYFYWLLAISVIVWLLEILFPWRTNQSIVRKDFWLDGFYILFNFFLFSLIIYNAVSNVAVAFFSDMLSRIGIKNMVAINLQALPVAVKFIIMFVVADFIQWNIHRLLHKSKVLWQFHKVHHSVEEMGFAAHFRFHFMETIIYKTLQYLPLAMLGFGLTDFFIVHIISVAIGHLNHSNLNWTYGPLKYVFNNPVMHLQHHSKKLPPNSYGVNFGLSLSLWDYLFKTNHLPDNGKNANTVLGFSGDANYPDTFLKQTTQPFKELFKKK